MLKSLTLHSLLFGAAMAIALPAASASAAPADGLLLLADSGKNHDRDKGHGHGKHHDDDHDKGKHKGWKKHDKDDKDYDKAYRKLEKAEDKLEKAEDKRDRAYREFLEAGGRTERRRYDGDRHHHAGWYDADTLTAPTLLDALGLDRSWLNVGATALPPGIAQNIQRGRPLPPGIARRDIPDVVESRLPAYDGYEWVRVGNDLALVDSTTLILQQLVQNLFL